METESNYPVTTPKFSKTSTRVRDTNDMSKVRVVVRVRPFLSQEIAARNGDPISCISTRNENRVSNDEVTVYLKDPQSSRKECYQVDSFFEQDDNNVCRIFEREVRPLISGLFEGFNATVFAYGATGSGKTYTMQGNDGFPGLMPLAVSTILTMCKETGSTVAISYYEVYLDRCYDLLELKEKEIRILDDRDGQIHLRGLSQAPVNSMLEFEEVFSCAVQRRKIAHTDLNDVSSRSHGVLVIRVSTPRLDGFVTGKINLIDLAGNEDNRRTCNEGIRLQESAKINQSLFALSNVIYALNNNNTRVPYRESKLTRILQDSLGGTSRALMVACLNPGEYQEAVHTVSLAARSRHITNFITSTPKTETMKTKVDMQEKLRAWLESKGKSKSLQRRQGCGTNSVQKRNVSSSVKAKVNSYRGASSTKERLPFWNLFDNEDVNDFFFEDRRFTVENNREETASEPVTNLSTGPLKEEEKMALQEPNHSIDVSPPAATTKALSPTPLRKALSPVNQNLNKTLHHEEAPNTGHRCQLFSEQKTPNDKLININTPLDKFNAMSSCLKSSLVQEFIDLLNTASKKELLSIKGIGQKMSEYVIELRETGPLKTLSDLEKIGLSSKQVHNLFTRAATGLFTGQECTTPPPSSKSVTSLFQ